MACGDESYAPFEFLDESGEPAGFNYDIFLAIARVMDLDVEVHLGPWTEVRSALEQGEIDVLMGMFRSEERDKKVDFTVPHCRISYALLAPESSVIADLEDCRGRKILVQSMDLAHDYVLEQELTDQVEPRPTLEAAIVSLAQGEGDCAIVALLQGTHVLEKLGVTGLKVVDPSLFQEDYCIAVRQGDAALVAKLNEGLAILLTTGEYERIREKWFSPQESPFRFLEALKYLGWILLLLALLALLGFFWSWRLRVEVASQTAIIQRELEERRRTEEALRDSELRFRSIFEVGPQGIVIIARESGEVLDSNQAFQQLTGYAAQAMLGQSLDALGIFPDQDFSEVCALREAEASLHPTLAAQLVTHTQERREVLLTAAEIIVLGEACVILGVLDVTEQQCLEEQLRHAQKMEAVGQLAGGVAHDLNNLLQAIVGYADLALQDSHGSQDLRESIREIIAAGDRASVLIRQLLAFSRRDECQPRTIDLNHLLRDLMRMVQRVIGDHIELTFLPTTELCPIYADSGQIEQVVVNLCVNARDAMEEGGRLAISTQRLSLDEADCREHPQSQVGDYVLLAVRDEGHGMEKTVQDRIFEPFYTTKPLGKGTGIGLATVYAIVERYKAFIRVESTPAVGTVFSLFFPISNEAPVLEKVVEPQQIEEEGGSGCILLAEDEASVRNLVVRILERAGYQVLVAQDGEEALRLFHEYQEIIDLALLDVMMPKVDGVKVREAIRALSPHLPVLLSSGYSQELLSQQSRFESVQDQILRKPYAAHELLARIRSLLTA